MAWTFRISLQRQPSQPVQLPEPAQPTPRDSPVDARLAVYEGILALWLHVDNIRWSALYYFLVASTVLILAWTAVYGSSPAPGKRAILVGLAAMGVLLSVLWAAFMARANRNFGGWDKAGRELELDGELRLPVNGATVFLLADDIRKRIPLPLQQLRTHRITLWVPQMFVVLYFALGAIALGWQPPFLDDASTPHIVGGATAPTAPPAPTN
jgi:hypothetical protein